MNNNNNNNNSSNDNDGNDNDNDNDNDNINNISMYHLVVWKIIRSNCCGTLMYVTML